MMIGKHVPSPCLGHSDRGAVTSIIAVLFAGGVIMGMLALSVDVGNIMFERRQLQNGADAASMALAQSCAKTPVGSECASAAAASAGLASLASANAADSSEGLPEGGICGKNISSLPTCGLPGSYTDLAQCTPLPSWVTGSSQYVETRTVTKSAGGSTILPSFFAKALLGGSTDRGYTACARAVFGPLGSTGKSVPLVISKCNWDQATSKNTPPYAPSPPYSPAPDLTGKTGPSIPSAVAPYVTQIFGPLNGSETDDALVSKFGCQGDLPNPSGAYAPGGFGWVDTVSGSCAAYFSSTGTLSSSTGTLPSTCKSGDLKSFVGTEVDIPVITAVSGTGTNAVFTVDGISSFFFAGYSNISAAGPSDFNVYGGSPCAAFKSQCIWGWFTSPIRPVGQAGGGGGTPRGPIVISPAG